MRLDEVTPVIITLNEAPNIARVLERLRWAATVLIVDSFSRDDTVAIARTFPTVTVIQNPFVSFAQQCNFALTQVKTSWVLALDADYVCSPTLAAEIEQVADTPDSGGYSAEFVYCINGRPLRAALYPPRIVLHRTNARYEDDGHAHRVRVRGVIGKLSSRIEHDDRKPLATWLASQARYAVAEADKLTSAPVTGLRMVDRLRRAGWITPILVPLHCLIMKGLVLDGRAGLFYIMQRMYAELLIALELWNRALMAPASDTRLKR